MSTALHAVPLGQPDAAAAPEPVLFRCLAWISGHFGDPRSAASWRHGVAAGHAGEAADPGLVIQAAQQAGYSATLVRRALAELPDYVLPAIVLLRDGQAAVWMRRTNEDSVEVALPEGEDGALLPVTLPLAALQARATGGCVLLKPPYRHDDRAGPAEAGNAAHWFWGAVWRFRSHYANAVLAAVMLNVLSLAGTFFTMNVYDRVVPTQAYPTLWTLAIGTVMAMVFELANRQLRSHLVDVAGRKIDLILGAALFRQALALRLERRPDSSGAFANRLREYESLREFTTSATLCALSDLPFALLFLGVVFAIGTTLGWVTAGAMALVALAGLLVQRPLARQMRENLREASLRHGMLVEALEGVETLKAANGQPRMQRLWEDCSAATAASALRARHLTSLTLNLVSLVQQLATVVLVVWGVYLIHQGHMSQGALIAVVMLSRQAVSPLGQAVGLAVRFQQAKVSLQTLDQLMAEPTDRPAGQTLVSRPRLEGALRAEALEFRYPRQTLPALEGVSLRIEPGERVAVLGRIGCGKSTLLRLFDGLYQPTGGAVLVDGIELRQLDPADLHRNVGLVAQDCRLFHGSLRDNIALGQPDASTERVLAVCRTVGLEPLIQRHPRGLDMPLGEGGAGLSGGQRQLVALARALLSDPPLLLMDEPTSAMDAQTEADFIQRLKRLPGRRTLVLATHRLSLLELVERVIVLEQGRVIADGPRAQVLQMLGLGAGSAAPRAAAATPLRREAP